MEDLFCVQIDFLTAKAFCGILLIEFFWITAKCVGGIPATLRIASRHDPSSQGTADIPKAGLPR